MQTSPMQPNGMLMERVQKELTSDFQKHIINAEGFRRIFYSRVAGYQEKYVISNEHLKSGEVVQKYIPKWVPPDDTRNRVGNDAYAEFTYTDVYPLISAQMATSKQTKFELFDKWRTKLYTLYLESERSWYFHPKLYCIDIKRLPSFMSFLGGISGMSSKALEGWAYEKMSTAEGTQRIIHEGGMVIPQQQSHGILSGVANMARKIW